MKKYDADVLKEGLQAFNDVNFFYGDPDLVMDKADGSLISSYLDANGKVKLKSKTSIGSDYAALAMELLNNDQKLYELVAAEEMFGRTVNMELVSPDPKFRIVLHYKEPKLVVLNVRHRNTGNYLLRANLVKHFPKKYLVGEYFNSDVLNHLDTVKNVEGYVVVDNKGNWWKEKCKWYLERHRAKDFINQPLAFIELVLKDEADDVFTLLADQPEILKEMQDLQHKVINFSNRLVNNVNNYYEANKHLDRKNYALKAQKELSSLEFAPAMMHYGQDEEPNFKAYLLKMVRKINWGNISN